MPKVVFLCKGTRGDVHPILSIALAYKTSHATDEVVIVCTLSSITGLVDCLALNGLKVISTLPETPNLFSCTPQRVQELSSDSERLQLLKSEAEVCFQACIGAQLIVFNLFSLEGYFIAQHLNVPCIAASPHLIIRTPPAGFATKLSHALPDLYRQLKSANDSSSNVVSLAEVDHWMWRLFLDDYGSVCEHIGFSCSVPFSSSSLPPPTPLLYGVSSVMSPRQPYWPQSVHLCGYWFPPLAIQSTPDHDLAATIELKTKRLVYIGFGSMETYLLEVDWTSLLEVLETALESAHMEGLLQCRGDGPIQQAYNNLSTSPQSLMVYTKCIPHQWLFEKCVAIIHHGGSGTVATSLLAKKPQLISPVMFDQEHWAELIVWKKLGVRLSPVKLLTLKELSSSLKLVSDKDIAANIEEVYSELVKEDGVKNALTEIEKLLSDIEV